MGLAYGPFLRERWHGYGTTEGRGFKPRFGQKKNVTCVLDVGVDTGVVWGVIIHIVCTHVR